MSNLGRDAGLPCGSWPCRGACAGGKQTRALASGGAHGRDCGSSLEDRDSGCPGGGLGAGPSIQTLQGLQMRGPDQITAHSLLASSTLGRNTRGHAEISPAHAPDPHLLGHSLATGTVEGNTKIQSASELVRRRART